MAGRGIADGREGDEIVREALISDWQQNFAVSRHWGGITENLGQQLD